MPEQTVRNSAAGELALVSTPIGNLGDITLRALTALKEADGILAEDTRRTRKLCQHYAIPTQLHSYHANSPDSQTTRWVKTLKSGQRLCLVTDAGTPLVSDPGQRLVDAALRAGVHVTALPGPSAVLHALVVSGLATNAFTFLGFLARSGKTRAAALSEIAKSPHATVLFESPRRLRATLSDLEAAVGMRRVAVCRELTKLHEETVIGTAAALGERFSEGTKGEVTIVVSGNMGPKAKAGEAEIAEMATRLLEAGLTARDAGRALCIVMGADRKTAYKAAMSANEGDAD